jgi:uncharacterized membrane protein
LKLSGHRSYPLGAKGDCLTEQHIGPGFWRRTLKLFFSGLMIMLPLILSVTVLTWVFNRLTGWLPMGYRTPLYRLAALVFLILLITGIGWLTRRVVGKRLHAGAESVIFRVPVLNRIYGFFKEISLTVLGAKRAVFNRVVLIEYPKPGTYAIAFVTNESPGEIQAKTGRNMIAVFLPTSPNPTSGFLLIVPKDKTIPLEMNVTEGIRMVISGGSLTPEYQPLPAPQHQPTE